MTSRAARLATFATPSEWAAGCTEALHQLDHMSMTTRADLGQLLEPLGVAIEDRLGIRNHAGNNGFHQLFRAGPDIRLSSEALGDHPGSRHCIVARVESRR